MKKGVVMSWSGVSELVFFSVQLEQVGSGRVETEELGLELELGFLRDRRYSRAVLWCRAVSCRGVNKLDPWGLSGQVRPVVQWRSGRLSFWKYAPLGWACLMLGPLMLLLLQSWELVMGEGESSLPWWKNLKSRLVICGTFL